MILYVQPPTTLTPFLSSMASAFPPISYPRALLRRTQRGEGNKLIGVPCPPPPLGAHTRACSGYQVTLSSEGAHVAGSPFPLHVSPGPAFAATSVCDDCEAELSTTDGNFLENSTKVLSLSAR